MERNYYSDPLSLFLKKSEQEILGKLAESHPFRLEPHQRNAWLQEIKILKEALKGFNNGGKVYFEFSIPRLGGRIDALVIIRHIIFVIEFKIGETEYSAFAKDQVWDYALDLKYFHETSHDLPLIPILVASEASNGYPLTEKPRIKENKFIEPITTNKILLSDALRSLLSLDQLQGPSVDISCWEKGRYNPTPTIVEAATALYGGHSVEDLSRNDAGAINLGKTSKALTQIIQEAKKNSKKVICFVTGVPGAGKTLVGLDIAIRHMDKSQELYSVYLSGNGPLVRVLREALARDKIKKEREKGKRIRKKEALREAQAFIQNVHHFRDDCIEDPRPPLEHVAIFDEAQRAWDLEQTSKFMKAKKGIEGFDQSEPDFLISCLNRHSDWAAIVCLVGGGQEINTGEAGINEWIQVILKKYSHWHVYLNSQLKDAEYGAFEEISQLESLGRATNKEEMHLSVSMRSFRAEQVSTLFKELLDLEKDVAKETSVELQGKYPIHLTRDLNKAKNWLRQKAQGTERFGLMVSSQAFRLKPHGMDIRPKIDPIHWFLNGKEDVRSSYYLEDVATEFDVQGLELDWACVAWDADFRFNGKNWEHWSFKGNRWQRIRKREKQKYLKNAYRVLLTRARQGMVIFVPQGEKSDPTRDPSFYDPTFNYLKEIGFAIL